MTDYEALHEEVSNRHSETLKELHRSKQEDAVKERVAAVGLAEIAEAITAHWGSKCPDFDAACKCCSAWSVYNALTINRSLIRNEALEQAAQVAEANSWRVDDPGAAAIRALKEKING